MDQYRATLSISQNSLPGQSDPEFQKGKATRLCQTLSQHLSTEKQYLASTFGCGEY